MPKTKVDDWSTTAASNTDIDGISIQGSAPRSNFDNALRELMSQVRATPLRESAADMRTAMSVQTQAENDTRYLNKVTGGAIGGTAVRGDKLEIIDETNLPASITEYSNAGGATLRALSAKGTLGAPVAVTSGWVIGGVAAFGHDGTSFSTTARARVTMYAAENWTTSAHGTYIQFNVTPTGTITPVTAGVIAASGALEWNYHVYSLNGNIASKGVVGGNSYYWFYNSSGTNVAAIYTDNSTNTLLFHNYTSGKNLQLLADGTVTYAGVKVFEADGTVVAGGAVPTAGNVICCHAVSYANRKDGGTTYSEVAKFMIIKAGTIRARVTQVASPSGGTQYTRVMKNGVQQAEWTTTSTSAVEQTTDISVAIGDSVSFEAKYVSYAGYVYNCQISSGAFSQCAVGGA